jgi:hypothetical protein
MISRAFSILIFFAALLGSGALLSEVQPFAIVPEVREKYAWLAGHIDEYDTLFIGSSRVYRGIMPAVFDELTAAAGVPTHSFNLGIDGMRPPEDAYVFERVLALRPKRLRWVFIETGEVRKSVIRGIDGDVRSLHWHDTQRTILALKALLAPVERPLRWKKVLFGSAQEHTPLVRTAAHIRLWFMRTLNAGRGAFLVRSWLVAAPTAPLSTVIGEEADGFMPDDRPTPAEVRADYLHDLMNPSRISYLDRDTQHSLDGMLTRVSAAGARPVLLITPLVEKYRCYPQPGSHAPLLDYGESEKRPSLFQIDHRVDHSHLNATGADLFTRVIASDFIELARSTAR